MKTETSTTPITDAALAWVGGNCAITVIDEMRKTEKQLTAATEALEKVKAELADAKSPFALTAEFHAWLKSLGLECVRIDREQSGKREAALAQALMSVKLRLYEAESSDINNSWSLGSLIAVLLDENEEAFEKASHICAALSQQAPTNDTQG